MATGASLISNQPKGVAKGAAAKGPNYNSPLYQPGQLLSGKALGNAAKSIANQQVNPVIQSLAAQRAQNNANNAGEQRTDFNYYMQLAQAAKDAVSQAQNVGTGLQSTLAGNAAQAQTQLGQLGQLSTGGALARMNALGLDAGQTAALGAETGRQQGIGTLNAQTAQNFGAQQSANITGQAIANRGAGALAGTQAIGALSRAGTIANQPINQKIADTQAQRGTLTTTALGQLRSQERNYQVAQEGLGVKTASLNATAKQNQARNQLTASGQRITAANDQQRNSIAQQNDLANQLDKTAALNEKTHNDAATQANRAAALAARSAAAGKPKALTTQQQNVQYGEIDRIQALISHAQSVGHAGTSIRSALQGGTYARGVPAYVKPLVDAAYELKGWGFITPATATALHAMGMRGGRYQVKNPPAAARPGGILGAVGGAAG
jgi:hypothetical protein